MLPYEREQAISSAYDKLSKAKKEYEDIIPTTAELIDILYGIYTTEFILEVCAVVSTKTDIIIWGEFAGGGKTHLKNILTAYFPHITTTISASGVNVDITVDRTAWRSYSKTENV